MSAESTMLAGRERIGALMADACTVVRAAAGSVFDPDTGLNVPVAGATVYAGACRIQSAGSSSATPDAGDHQFTEQGYIISIPIGSLPDVGDIVTITAAAYDPANVGRKFTVDALLHKTHASAQRLGCSEVVG